jgi:hypothetical protein
MKKILLLPFFFAFQAGVFAQDYHYADSLKHLIATEQEEDTTTVIHYLRLAYYYTWSFPDTAIMYYQKAYLLSNQLEFRRGLIYALEGQAYPLSLVREDSAAVSVAFRSIQLAEEAKDNRRLAGAWFTLGSVYIHLRDFEKGLLYHRKALGYASSSDTDFINVTNQHIAGCFLGLNQPDSADMYAKKVLKYNKLHQIENGFDVYQMGSVFFQKGLLDSALRYYREGLAMVTKQGILKDMANCNLGIANVFQERQVYDSAIYYAKAAWKIAGMTGLANEKLEALDQLTSLFAATGNTDSAFVYQQYALQLKDNIYNADKVRQVQLLAFNEELRKQQETEEQRKRSNRILVYTLLALLAFTIIIAGIIYRNNKLRQKAYALLKRQKEEIDRQKRAAEIEAALERIRAKAMAMHHSDELDEVLSVLCAQFDLLGINPMSTHITLLDIEHNKFTFRETGKFGDRSFGEQTVALDAMDTWKDMVESWKSAEPYSINRLHFPKETLAQVWEVFHESFASMPEGSKITPDDYPDGIYHTAGKHPFGYIGMNQIRKATPAEEQIVVKFANEFGRAYQRFLDLQKAEAQAREAQIEAALERVRSRTMAMHSSQDVDMIVTTLFDELLKLGVDKSIRSGIGIMDKSRRMEVWTASTNPSGNTALDKGILDMGIHQLLIEVQEAWEAKKTTNSYELVGDDLINYFKTINDAPEYSFQVDFEKLPNKIIHYDFFFPEGALFAFSPTPLSDEISRVFMRFASVFGQTYRRYLDLQKAEAQAREAQIEAALERVRARTMAMQSSNELRDVALELRKQMGILEISELETCAIHLYEGSEDHFTSWAASKSINNESGYILSEIHFPRKGVSSLEEIIDLYRKKTMDYVVTNDHKRLSEFMEVLKDVMPETYKIVLETFESVPENKIKTFWALADFNGGSLVISTTTMPSNDTRALLRRFANVFNLSYQRFSDLKQAEAQAREAKIELALERVRAAAMAMHQSDELPDMLSVLFDQFDILGINPSFTHLTLFDEINETFSYRMSGTAGHRVLVEQIHDINRLEAWKIAFEQWKSGDPNTINCIDYPPEVLPMIFDIIEPILSSMPEESRVRIEDFPNGLYTVQGHCKFGYLGFHHHRRATEEEKNIVVRFAGEFGRVYQRFLDLQKAEAQAREAQIEAALERIRSRAMAMQHSEELRDVALELRTQMGILGQKDLEVCAIHLYEEHKDHFESWAAMHLHGKEERLLQFQALFPKSGKLIIDEMMECYASDQNEYVLVNEGEKGKQWFELLREKAPEAFQYIMEAMPNMPAQEIKAYWGIADFSGGALVMVTYFYPDKDSRDLLRRTANVFALAYKRFKDLRMAESSARAARRQASLDRIRADISSMRNAEDLNRITPLVFNELTALGIPFIRCGVFIVHEKEENVEIYLSTPEGKSLAVMTLPFSANEMTSKSVEAWKKEEVYIQHWNQTDFTNWGKSMQEQGYVKDLKTYQGTETAPESLHLHFVPFTQGLLYVGSPENLSEEQIDLVKSMAKAFSIAYARYEDFTKLEQAKVEVESAMSELKATQSQLVQQEKLASLGQLTAGIAHEIKNPLNFVNNFSEVSMEMIEEIKEERAKSQETRDETLVDEILEDIQSNLGKIHEHGSGQMVL